MTIPFVVLYTTQARQRFIFIVCVILPFVFLLKGYLEIISFVCSIIAGIIIGWMFKQKKPAYYVFIVSWITFLMKDLILLGVVKWLWSFSPHEYVIKLLDSQRMNMVFSSFYPQLTDAFKQLIRKMIPSLLIIKSLCIGTITYVISCKFLKITGLDVQPMKPFRQWKLPRSVAVYYVILLVIKYFQRTSSDNFITVILWNLELLLLLACIIQGIAVIFYVAYEKKWSKIIPIVVTVTAFLNPILLFLLEIIGFLELLLSLRKFLSKPKI